MINIAENVTCQSNVPGSAIFQHLFIDLFYPFYTLPFIAWLNFWLIPNHVMFLRQVRQLHHIAPV
jgi:hypothetical protein